MALRHLHCIRYHLNSILCDSYLYVFAHSSFIVHLSEKDIAVFVLHNDRTWELIIMLPQVQGAFNLFIAFVVVAVVIFLTFRSIYNLCFGWFFFGCSR